MHKPNKEFSVDDYYLANGKSLSKENIDIPVLMNLNNVQRAFSFAGVPPTVNLNVTSHSYLTMLVSYRFIKRHPEFTNNQLLYSVDVDKIASGSMLHDIAEALLGDIPTPLKHPSFAEFEDKVKDNIFGYLGVDTDSYNKHYSFIRLADLVASLYECDYSTSKGYDLSLIFQNRLNKIYDEFTIAREDCAKTTSAGYVVDRNSNDFVLYWVDEENAWQFKLSRSLMNAFISEIVGRVIEY
jgi:5'-deoxynucleotidase YfbR-like HD superfamily hydrolase